MVVTDLDGTLLNNEQCLSEKDRRTLEQAGDSGIVRVVATGRNIYSAKKVIDPAFPIDYLIFSSGTGIIDWKTGHILFSHKLPSEHVVQISHHLIKKNIDFMLHRPVPNNHEFLYHRSGQHNPDFERRIDLYKDYAAPLNSNLATFGNASQFITIIPNDVFLFDHLKAELAEFKVIRATSPLDGKTMWVEIFPPTVSKARASQWLCEKLMIHEEHVLAIGNDYNDLDLLYWAKHSYVVSNAPDELKTQFKVTVSNAESGFSVVVLACRLIKAD